MGFGQELANRLVIVYLARRGDVRPRFMVNYLAFALAGVMPVVALGGLFYAARARPTPRPLPPDARVEAVA